MKLVPAGLHPAAALAAAMLNYERGCVAFDPAASGAEGRLVPTADPGRPQLYVFQTATGPAAVSYEARYGVIYITPTLAAGKSTAFSYVESVRQMLETAPPAAPGGSGGALTLNAGFHERLSVLLPVAGRDLIVDPPDLFARLEEGYDRFVWAFCTENSEWGQRRTPRDAWVAEIAALFQDIGGGLDALYAAEGQTLPIDWAPTWEQLGVPELTCVNWTLALVGGPAGSVQVHKNLGHMGYWRDDLASAAPLEAGLTAAEVAYLEARLAAAEVCALCEVHLWGLCGVVLTASSAVPVCRVCAHFAKLNARSPGVRLRRWVSARKRPSLRLVCGEHEPAQLGHAGYFRTTDGAVFGRPGLTPATAFSQGRLADTPSAPILVPTAVVVFQEEGGATERRKDLV